MREILFRGKRIDGGVWVEGGLLFLGEPRTFAEITYRHEWEEGKFYIVRAEVDPETVGQYTELNANGKMIFEGDIVKGIFLFGEQILSVVKFSEGSFGLAWQRGNVEEFTPFTGMCNVEYEIIGNIHDNPELLKGGNA